MIHTYSIAQLVDIAMPHLHTTLAHAGTSPDPETGALSPPIHPATTFERDADGGYSKGFVYSRDGNPTRTQLETTLATIEGGIAARAFSSGMAAAHAVLQSIPPGSHILIPDDVYHGVRRLVVEQFQHRGLEMTAVDMSEAGQFERAIRANTRLIWVETPSNPLLKITDLKKVGQLARDHESLFVVDGTWTTPLLQRPFEYGADYVVHSLTKYLGGHSDTLGGAVVAREESTHFTRLTEYQKQSGAVLDPFSSWLTLRGIRTLNVRLSRQCATANRVAGFLESRPEVACVHYPGLSSHPSHELAAKQMDDFGAMLSFEALGGQDHAMAITAAVNVFTRATSLGGTESLIEHRASVEGPESSTSPSLLRVSIGLEHPEDLIADLEGALTNS